MAIFKSLVSKIAQECQDCLPEKVLSVVEIHEYLPSIVDNSAFYVWSFNSFFLYNYKLRFTYSSKLIFSTDIDISLLESPLIAVFRNSTAAGCTRDTESTHGKNHTRSEFVPIMIILLLVYLTWIRYVSVVYRPLEGRVVRRHFQIKLMGDFQIVLKIGLCYFFWGVYNSNIGNIL